MKLEEQIEILNKAIAAKKPIHFCWSENKEEMTSEQDGLVRVQTSYSGAERKDIAAHRNKETFLLLVPLDHNSLLYLNSSGRTLLVKDPEFINTRGQLDFWFRKVEDENKLGMFV